MCEKKLSRRNGNSDDDDDDDDPGTLAVASASVAGCIWGEGTVEEGCGEDSDNKDSIAGIVGMVVVVVVAMLLLKGESGDGMGGILCGWGRVRSCVGV